MKPWITWSARLGVAGVCLMVTGCGGGDVPDASSEGQVATHSAPAAGAAPAEAPAAAQIDGEKVAQAGEPAKSEETPAEAAAPGAAPSPAPAAPAAPAAGSDEETAAASPKPEEGKGNSNTAEMLAMATGPPAGASPDAAPSAPSTPGAGNAAPAAPGSAAPGGPAQGGGGPGGGMAMRRPGMPGMNSGGMQPPGGPGGPGGSGAMPGMVGNRPGTGGPPGMAGGGGPGGPGGPGQPGGPGGSGQDNAPADFHSPEGAVRAFLSALKAKDLDRLNEATALRAQQEAASSKSQDLFKKIFELSLSDSELDQLADALKGYTISGENPPKSTGRVEVILRKTGTAANNNAGGYFLRKVTVRHEKKGWGVLDIAGEMEFKPMNMIPKRGAGGRRR
jgi:hypothetical protein